MDKKRKWRALGLALLTVLSIAVLLPSFEGLRPHLPVWFSKIFNKRVKFGLDLYGGLHVVYSIDLNKAVDDKATEIRRDVEAKLAEIKVKGRVNTPPSPPGAVAIILDNEADKKRIDDAFFSDYAEVITDYDCPAGENQARSVCVRVSSDFADRIKKSAIDQAIRTIRDRIDRSGIAEASVVSKDEQVIVELPGDKEQVESVRELIERTAKLEFKVVDSGDDGQGTEYMRKLYAHVSADPKAKELGLKADIESWVNDESKNNETFTDYLIQAEDVSKNLPVAEAKALGCWRRDSAIKADGTLSCKVQGRAVIAQYMKELIAEKPEFKLDDEHQFGYEETEARREDGSRYPVWRTYYLKRPVELAGSAVTQAAVYFDDSTGEPYVLLRFDRLGGRRWGELTGSTIGRKVAIILDEEVSSAPIIQGKIPNGVARITMGARNSKEAFREAEVLRDVLLTGSLPAPLREDSSSEVGPLLGKDAIDKTKLSFAVGSLLVIVIMMTIYRFSGVISIIALALNVLFMMAALVAFGATLTLPGIAALVLTVGMAVDSNIIIYERIRDELRAGKSVKGAVEAGFARALWAILDGQITTLLAGLVLAAYGSGPIRGFAVMLIIGLFATTFTAYWCTKLFFDFYVNRRGKATVLSI